MPIPIQEQDWFEELGELAMTEYYRVLSESVAVTFGVQWNHLNPCEQEAWVAAAKLIATVATQYKQASEEFPIRNNMGWPAVPFLG